MSADGGVNWQRLLTQTLATGHAYDGEHAHTYTFRVTATDYVRNSGQGTATASTGNAVTKYYYFPSAGSGLGNGQRVALRTSEGEVNWLHGDHPSPGSGQAWAAPRWRRTRVARCAGQSSHECSGASSASWF